ncbi:MAG: ATP-binding cassette domain-containing protein [Minisyncoccia bacterium]
MLSATGVTKKCAGKEVIGAINITIKPGTITSLIGPSGAGKTTLLHALSLTDIPDAGAITIDEKHHVFPNTEDSHPSSSVVLVFQQLFLWPHLTLRENILLANRLNETEMHELISAFGMEEFVDRYPNQTSLGQRQRGALARAIACKPRYLLLDEVTSALDIEQIELVMKYLMTLKNRGVGILLVTHLLHFAEQVSDRIVFMDKGTIIESGGKDLLTNPQRHRTKDFLKYF